MTTFAACSPISLLGSFSSISRVSSPIRLNSHFHNSHCKFQIKCSYADANVNVDYGSSTIDVVADVKTERVVVLGGNGFVGSAICKAAVSKGIEVISLNRSGRPTYPGSWVDQVTWISGDVFYANWDEVLVGATAVVSTLGGVGSEEQMLRINGEANITAVNAAKNFACNYY
uniref:NAD-dependent epimerase/dehydratase domain-containing protein n=1 Tax=Manihot esculenta TaxID=3983 RepID=A0A2C9U3X2_MANES